MCNFLRPFLIGCAGAVAVLLVIRGVLDYRDFLALREQAGQVQNVLSHLQTDSSGIVHWNGGTPAPAPTTTTVPAPAN